MSALTTCPFFKSPSPTRHFSCSAINHRCSSKKYRKPQSFSPYIKEIVDSSDDKGAFWLTGSQPFHLMSTVSESLAGRAGIIEMLGLSGSEIYGTASEPFGASPEYFMRRIGMCSPQDVNQVYSDICKGSLPGLRALPDDLRPGGYESYLDTYIMRDIRDLAQVGDELKFRRFMTACAARCSLSKSRRPPHLATKMLATWARSIPSQKAMSPAS